jgi:intracellular sulfur oxidation DsrE/DsrF family protein
MGGLLLMAVLAAAAEWAKPVSPVIPEASGYVAIPGAAVMPDKGRTYKAVYDATRAAGKPGEILPALDMAGSELNLFGATGVPADHVRFVVVFHGAALDALLDDAHYRAKHGVPNPNLRVMSEMRKAGVELFVCGQNLAFENIDPATLTKDVRVASDALVVLMTYQQDGYALLSF